MVINEKALVRQMKEAYRSGGYSVTVSHDITYLSNGYWLAGINTDNVPAAILGMFGEHIRDIPKNGDSYRVAKSKDGPVAQCRILEDAMRPINNMLSQRDEAWKDITLTAMRRTNITYDGLQIWQAKPGNGIYLIEPSYAAMVDAHSEVVQVGNGIYAEGEISQLWILRYNKKEAQDQIAHLEKIAWVAE